MMMLIAICGNKIKCAKYLHKYICATKEHCIESVGVDNVELLEYFYEMGIEIDDLVYAVAKFNCSKKCIKYIEDKYKECMNPNITYENDDTIINITLNNNDKYKLDEIILY